MNRRRIVFALVLTFAVALSVACKKTPKTTENAKRYNLEGRVVSVNKGSKELVIDHKDVGDYMKAMTMPFTVKDDWVFNVAKPGDAVTAELVVTDDDAWLENVVINKAGGSQPEPSTSTVGKPQSGEQVPDFAFTDQDGKKLRLSNLRGGPTLLTFIYSRCPLPDYCIRMSNNFAEVAKQLKRDNPEQWKRAHLLSISFDPKFDTPKVLREYGKSYAGAIDPNFQQWKFVTAPEADIKKTADYFGLSYEPQSGQIIHSLQTVLLDKDGRIVSVYSGNEWKPADVAKQLAEQK